MMTHLNSIARRKTDNPHEWEIFKWEAIGGGLIVTGGVPRKLKSGKRKGKLTWRDSKSEKVIITSEELKNEETLYEKTTGFCHHCEGKKSVFKSWDHIEGTKYQPCRDCSATGKANLNNTQPLTN